MSEMYLVFAFSVTGRRLGLVDLLLLRLHSVYIEKCIV